MSTLEQFRQELGTRLKSAGSTPRWPTDGFRRYMTALEPRRQIFEEAARRLLADVVKPRLDALVEFFPSARTRADEQAHCYCCWFAYSDRFPVTAKLEFSVEHDQAVEHLFVRYEASLMPLFLQFQPHDRLTLPLEQVDQETVVAWVEKRIFEFLDTYLRHDRGAPDLEEDIVTDPVCGMRLSRSGARETSGYRGHVYFFCSSKCRTEFEARPESFIQFRPI